MERKEIILAVVRQITGQFNEGDINEWSQTKQELIDVNEKYQGVVKEESIDKVIEGLRRRKAR